jgi:ornithine cyclodeaminase
MRLLSRRDLERLLTPASALEALEAAFRAAAVGRVAAPVRLPVEVGADGRLLYMPAVLRTETGSGAAGAKVVGVFPGNPSRGLPLIHAVYLLHDAETGRPAALLEAGWLTGLRTAAASALAATRLARPDASTLALLGAGVQAAFHLEAMLGVRPIRRVLIAGRSRARVEQLAVDARTRHPGLEVEVAASPDAAVAEADLVVAATTSRTPVLRGATLRPGAFVALVGAFTPDAREADTEAICRSRVYVDTYEGAMAEAGDLLIPIAEGALAREGIVGDLAALVAGSVPGRRSPDEITLFKSVGAAIEDLAVAMLAVQLAEARGVGTLWSQEGDSGPSLAVPPPPS